MKNVSNEREKPVLVNQLVTIDDLRLYTEEMMAEIRLLFERQAGTVQKKWLKSYEVRRMLNISPGTLQTYRANGMIPFTRLGGSIYYDQEAINRLMAEQKAGKRS
ncbi:helix-turn-helix domain-containing protein [Chitinophaga sp. YIM B06452]|uniref:helix-turn-helix domain-containing protein n=1 Tax=Chitinophaga sp. YIM B06452 TaxID=3082158 RepID=UPI0031FEEC5B